MATEVSTVGVLLRSLFLFSIADLVHGYAYPITTSKRFVRSVHPPAYVPAVIPVAQRISGYQAPDYDDNYIPPVRTQVGEFGAYEVPEQSMYEYYPQTGRKEGGTFGYVEDRPEDDSVADLREEPTEDKEANYPYGRETWFEGGDDEEEADDAFVQNLVTDQMYRDSEEKSPVSFGRPKFSTYVDPSENDEDERTWSYGIPVTEVDDEEMENREDESVRELESLVKASEREESNLRGEGRTSHQREENFSDFPKQFGRKNLVTVGEGLQITKKQIYDSGRVGLYHSKGTTTVEKAKASVGKSKTVPTTEAPTSTEKPKKSTARSPIRGQKEYVLPRPANPIRRPFERNRAARSGERPSAYNTIKKLLSMEGGLREKEIPRVQKRFVLNEDQLTSQLSGLKKMSV